MNKKSNLSSQILERLANGILKENPTFVLLLGMCPTLAVTTSAMNGLGMGLTTMAVLALSNLMISALRKIIPNKVRIPAFIVIIASFVTIVELLLKGYIPSLYDSLGLYIPLIVVNCIILGRAEAYAYSNPILPSLFDGIGMGLGFSIALTIIGGVREILGAGQLFGYNVMPSGYIPVSIFIMAPGAFFVLAILTAIQNAVKIAGEKKGKDMSKIQSGCGHDCMNCDKDCKLPEGQKRKPKKVADLSKKDKASIDKSEGADKKDTADINSSSGVKDDKKPALAVKNLFSKKANKEDANALKSTDKPKKEKAAEKPEVSANPEAPGAVGKENTTNPANETVNSAEANTASAVDETNKDAVSKEASKEITEDAALMATDESNEVEKKADDSGNISENTQINNEAKGDLDISETQASVINEADSDALVNIANDVYADDKAKEATIDQVEVAADKQAEADGDDIKIYVAKTKGSEVFMQSRKEFDTEFAKLIDSIAAGENIGAEGTLSDEDLFSVSDEEQEEFIFMQVENVVNGEEDYEEPDLDDPDEKVKKSFHGLKRKKKKG